MLPPGANVTRARTSVWPSAVAGEPVPNTCTLASLAHGSVIGLGAGGAATVAEPTTRLATIASDAPRAPRFVLEVMVLSFVSGLVNNWVSGRHPGLEPTLEVGDPSVAEPLECLRCERG